jgi:hypothetical protein
LVTATDKSSREQVAIQGIAHGDALRRRAQKFSGGEAQGQGGEWGNDDRGNFVEVSLLSLIETVENGHSLTHEKGLRRKAIEGQGVMPRETSNAGLVLALAEHSAKGQHRRVRRTGMRGDVKNRSLAVGADEMARRDAIGCTAQTR